MEAWKVVEGFPNYEVSDEGGLRSGFGKVKVLGCTWDDGYKRTRLSSARGVANVYIHKLMMHAFVGECPEGMVCHHIDGDSKNNVVKNLKYVPVALHESLKWKDRERVLPKNQGEGNGRSKLTVCDIIVMRGIENLSLSKLAKIFEVGSSHVHKILQRKKWAHVPV